MPRLVILLLPLLLSLAGVLQAADKPNIIYIMLDDAGYADFGAFGSPHVQTPVFDRMCREGMKFTQHYSGSAVCAPTRSVLMTGLHTGHTPRRDNMATAHRNELPPNANGAKGMVFLEPEDLTVAESLQQAGYATGGIGKWGLGNPGTTGQPEKQGFDYWYGYLDQVHAHDHFPRQIWDDGKLVDLPGNQGRNKGDYVPYLQETKTLDFIKRHRDDPFFLYLAYTPPHGAYVIPESDPAFQLYRDKPWPAKVKHYAAMITRTDQTVGKILALLKELELDNDTIVFYTSDNGPNPPFLQHLDSNGPLRGIKRQLYEGGLRAAMTVRWPGHVPAGQTSELIWDMRDFFPTACDLAGIDPPQHLDGMSVLPTLLGKQQQPHDHLYWEIHHPFQQAVRMGRWKAIRFGTEAPLQLYDLQTDVGETMNLARNHPQVVKQIEGIMNESRTESRYFPAVKVSRGKKKS